MIKIKVKTSQRTVNYQNTGIHSVPLNLTHGFAEAKCVLLEDAEREGHIHRSTGYPCPVHSVTYIEMEGVNWDDLEDIHGVRLNEVKAHRCATYSVCGDIGKYHA
jgi:hypothetical protein